MRDKVNWAGRRSVLHCLIALLALPTAADVAGGNSYAKRRFFHCLEDKCRDTHISLNTYYAYSSTVCEKLVNYVSCVSTNCSSLARNVRDLAAKRLPGCIVDYCRYEAENCGIKNTEHEHPTCHDLAKFLDCASSGTCLHAEDRIFVQQRYKFLGCDCEKHIIGLTISTILILFNIIHIIRFYRFQVSLGCCDMCYDEFRVHEHNIFRCSKCCAHHPRLPQGSPYRYMDLGMVLYITSHAALGLFLTVTLASEQLNKQQGKVASCTENYAVMLVWIAFCICGSLILIALDVAIVAAWTFKSIDLFARFKQ